jgi:hypothetical protein
MAIIVLGAGIAPTSGNTMVGEDIDLFNLFAFF